MKTSVHALWGAAALSVFAGLASANEVLTWNSVNLQAIRTGLTPPPLASRGMAMVSTAMFDAVNAIDRTHFSYRFDPGPQAAGTSREAAAASAAHRVLSSLYPAQAATFDAQLASSLAAIPDSPGKTAGINLGTASGDTILAFRANDGAGAMVPYTPGTNPGDWRPTLPANAPALLPGWGNVTPFGIASGSQFQSPVPPSLTSAEYTASFNQVKELGAVNSATRTQDQTNIARFWADGGGTATPPGHWNRIAAGIAQQQGLTLSDSARLFALLNMATADAGIACWDTKYEFNFWRPIAGIREADTDGNPNTVADPNWTPLIPTPPFPAYTSGHSTFSAAGATVLAGFFGTDAIAFTSSAEGFVVPDRSFSSFSEAALEASLSRIYGGIHWDFDSSFGIDCGELVGSLIMANYLQPIPAPGAGLALFGAGCLLTARRRRN